MTTLVSNCPNHTKHIDPNIINCGGLVTEDQTIWVASQGNGLGIVPNVSRYDLSGRPLIEPLLYTIPLGFGVLASTQIMTLSDLFWLRKGVLATMLGAIATVPKIGATSPAIGTADNQPTEEEIALETFYNPPNGYFGGSAINVNISVLIRFCILHPEAITTPPGMTFNTLLQQAHNIYLPLSLDQTNLSLKRSYALALQAAQNHIPLLGFNLLTSSIMNVQSPKITPMTTPPPSSSGTTTVNVTSVIINPSKGFVFTSPGSSPQKASSHLIATRGDNYVYVYAPLVVIPGLQAVISSISGVDKHAVYTSVATINDQLYVTDMANRAIDVFNFNFEYLFDLSQTFMDPDIPVNYTPVNIVVIHNHLYVVYNLLDNSIPISSDTVINHVRTGRGLGIIKRYRPDGTHAKMLVQGGRLDAPWGLTSLSDGGFAVGNHGDGRVLIYDSQWRLVSKHRRFHGLWGIQKAPCHQDQLLCCSTKGTCSSLIRFKIC